MERGGTGGVTGEMNGADRFPQGKNGLISPMLKCVVSLNGNLVFSGFLQKPNIYFVRTAAKTVSCFVTSAMFVHSTG